MNRRVLTTFFLLLILIFNETFANEKIFYQIDLKKEIGSTTWIYVKNGYNEAVEVNADAVIINMNTYGGTVVHADSIRTTILNSEIPTYVFIDNNAASAGALIAIACDSIYMKKGANIGAVTVVNQTGEAMPDKYQSYMRSTIRSTAEAKGKDTVMVKGKEVIRWRRDPLIAEGMVDQRIVVPGIVDSTMVITFTTEDAIKHHYCEGEANSVNDIIENKLGVEDYKIIRYKPSTLDEIMGWLTSPVVQGILITVMFLGIFYEVRTPGVGFPGLAAVIAATLYFAPLYIEGLAQYWEILIFFIGLIMIFIEIFFIPGFGILGLGGIIIMVAGLVLALVNNVNFSFEEVEIPDLRRSLYTVVSGITVAFALIIFIISRFGKGRMFKFIALTKEEKKEDGYIAVDHSLFKLVEKEGISQTILRPAGKIIIDNEYYDAVSLYGYIEPETKIKVVKFENAQLYVIKID